MILTYTTNESELNFLNQSYLKDFKEKEIKAQALHMFNNSAIYFEDYPKKNKLFHINLKMAEQLFIFIDRYKYVNEKTNKEVYLYILHLPGNKVIGFASMNESKPFSRFKLAGVINSQIAAVNTLVKTANKLLYSVTTLMKGSI